MCSFIVSLHVIFGHWCFVCSYITGLFPKGCGISTKVLIYREQLLYASCGPFGENAIYLKRLNTLLDLNFFFLCTMNDWMATPCMIGFIFLCAL